MPISPARRVADTIRAELARRRLTQRDLADTLGISQTAASRRLTGEVVFDVAELFKVAAWLGIPSAALLDEGRVAS